MASSIAVVASSTSVPYSNWAVTKPIELAEVELTWSMPETESTARSIGATTWSATSSAPAAGKGAMTVATGNETSGRSSCLRLPQAMTPKMKSPTARRMVTLRRSTAARVSQVIRWCPREAAGRIGQQRQCAFNGSKVLVALDSSEHLAQALAAELAEVLEPLPGGRGRLDDDLAAVRRVLVSLEQAELHEPVHHPG